LPAKSEGGGGREQLIPRKGKSAKSRGSNPNILGEYNKGNDKKRKGREAGKKKKDNRGGDRDNQEDFEQRYKRGEEIKKIKKEGCWEVFSQRDRSIITK